MNSNYNEKSIRGSSLELDEQNNLDHISLERKNVINVQSTLIGKKAKVLEKLTSMSLSLEQTQNAIDTDICSHRDANASEISVPSTVQCNFSHILKKQGINSRYFWHPLNVTKPFKQSFSGVNNSKFYYGKLMWLPSSLTLKKRDLTKICNVIN